MRGEDLFIDRLKMLTVGDTVTTADIRQAFWESRPDFAAQTEAILEANPSMIDEVQETIDYQIGFLIPIIVRWGWNVEDIWLN